MEELNENIQNMMNNYWNTLISKNIANIPSNKFIKKPYLEKYIIQLAVNLPSKHNNLKKNILFIKQLQTGYIYNYLILIIFSVYILIFLSIYFSLATSFLIFLIFFLIFFYDF